ncbi:MAG TPA: TetR/AcrR family transcriptional regulator [Pseudomonadales bacterium]|nr:TetR/AcrR family transcriptional regulator [Pseudomonadales bacterium]
MAVLSQATGLQKASLYHHFPGGKNEMLETAVLATIVELERRVFRFLDTNDDAAERIAQILEGFETYTDGGRRSCLLAVIAQSSVAENFKSRIGAQFSAWITRLSTTLVEFGHGPKRADTLALETLETLYGSLVVGRLLGTFEIFDLGLQRCRTNIGLADKIEFS